MSQIYINRKRKEGYSTYLGGLMLMGRPNYLAYKGSVYTCSAGEFYVGEIIIEKEVERESIHERPRAFIYRGNLVNFFKSAIIKDKEEITDFYK